MTQTAQSERLARMEEKQSNMAADIEEIKNSVKELKESMDKNFVTRAEAYIAGVVITTVAILINLWLNVTDHLK